MPVDKLKKCDLVPDSRLRVKEDMDLGERNYLRGCGLIFQKIIGEEDPEKGFLIRATDNLGAGLPVLVYSSEVYKDPRPPNDNNLSSFNFPGGQQ